MKMKTISTDRIERQILLRASRFRVWRALTDIREFGEWFGVRLDGPFVPGARVRGKITHPGFQGSPFEIVVERVLPEQLVSWRWHPYTAEPGVNYSSEPTTLVEFRLEELAGGSRLSVVESGFDSLPVARRQTAYEMNDRGWAEQMNSIGHHLGASGWRREEAG